MLIVLNARQLGIPHNDFSRSYNDEEKATEYLKKYKEEFIDFWNVVRNMSIWEKSGPS